MYSLLGNDRGNITLAMMLVLLGTLSSLALIFQAFSDTYFTLVDCDKEQVFLFLRSETERCETVLEKYDAMHEGFYLPEKRVTMSDSQKTRTYQMQSRLILKSNANSGLMHDLKVFDILSLVSVINSPVYKSGRSLIPSTVRGYSETTINQGSGLLEYMYFTDTDRTTNDTPNYYWGPDNIYGKVHSNSDIWVRQSGGGTNNGWPTFYGTVFTAGQIQSMGGNIPYSQVFRGGYFEHAAPLTLPVSANEIRAHGAAIGPTAYDPDRIMFVTVNGGSYSSWMGQRINAGPDTADVWTAYPPRAGTYLLRNRYTKYDTIWTAGPCGASIGHSNMVYSKMWFKGRVQGAQTWCAADTLYLNDNCYLAGTVLGGAPDGSVQGSSFNRSDYLGLVSEKSIVIQYGYRDPQDSTRYKPNCDGNGIGAIWIYAALCALGDGGGIPQKDGVFTFEYQHPHPSVPAVRLEINPNYAWDKIDLHRRKYPQTPNYPWPGEIDYPWYNPLWPEGFPYLERGTIHLWGSVAQRRSGYIHRNLTDSDYPNPAQVWNIPLDLCGGPAGNAYQDPVLNITWSAINAPNVLGSGVGYANKDYRYDSRLKYFSPPDFPQIHTIGGGNNYATNALTFKNPPRSLTVLD